MDNLNGGFLVLVRLSYLEASSSIILCIMSLIIAKKQNTVIYPSAFGRHGRISCSFLFPRVPIGANQRTTTLWWQQGRCRLDCSVATRIGNGAKAKRKQSSIRSSKMWRTFTPVIVKTAWNKSSWCSTCPGPRTLKCWRGFRHWKMWLSLPLCRRWCRPWALRSSCSSKIPKGLTVCMLPRQRIMLPTCHQIQRSQRLSGKNEIWDAAIVGSCADNNQRHVTKAKEVWDAAIVGSCADNRPNQAKC